MRRLVVLAVVAALTLGLAPTALADAPFHDRAIYTTSVDFQGGEVCDFAYRNATVWQDNYFEFGDLEAGGHILWQSHQRVVHTNLATGDALTETATVVEKFYPGTAVDKVVGIVWHLRDADGRLVAVHAGQFIVDYSGAVPVVVKITPKMDADFAGVICPALGGSPA